MEVKDDVGSEENNNLKLAKEGDKVTLEYEGRLEDGEVFDSSSHGDHEHPLTFVVGEGKVIKGFNDAVIGMKKNEEKEFTLTPDEAYGMPKPEMKQEVPKTALPPGQDPKAGMALVLTTQSGQQMPAKILEVTDDKVVIDMNHPLSGKTLIFKIKLVGIGEEDADAEKKKGEEAHK